MSRKPCVFISYRRKPAAHTHAVAALAKRLSDEGSMEILFDEYAGDPPEGWIRWMRTAVRDADKVLLVFNEPYQRCYEGDDENADEGKGSTFEGITIVGDFYNKKGHNDKYRAVILQECDREYVSVEFQRHTIYSPNDPGSYEQLLKWIHHEIVAAQRASEQIDPPTLQTTSLTDLLTTHRQRLERECATIPIFGRIREDIPMEKNFINLTLEATFSESADARGEKQVVPHARKWKGADRGERDEGEKERAIQRSRSASEIWSEFAKGVILGLPGAGKTTILRHFAHLDFTRAPSRLVLFIPCRSLTEAHLHPSLHRSGATPLRRALAQVAAAYLFPALPAGTIHLSTEQVRQVQDFLTVVESAWNKGAATILVDAYDETLPALRGAVADLCKELLLALSEARLTKGKETTRCFVSARYNEDQTFRDLQSPIFEVNPLNQEQMRDFARNLFTEESDTYQRFDELVWQEPVLQKMGRTPLTALLLLCYFDIYQRFDLRFRTYDLVLKFALLQVWDSIKGGSFQRDPRRVRQFFEEAASGAFEKQHPTLALRYEALGYLCHCALYRGAEGKVERRLPAATITGSFEMVLEGKTQNTAATAQEWLEELRHEHLLICDGRDYVFVHGTVQEFLAAHYLVHHLDDPRVIEVTASAREENGQQVTDSHETLPIACGHTLEHTASLFPLLQPYFPEWSRHRLLFRCLVEAESLEYRILRDKRTIPLREREISRLAPKVQAREWAYTLLARRITSMQTRDFEDWARWLAEEMRLSREILASQHFKDWWHGLGTHGPSAVTDYLLGLMLSQEVLAEQQANRRRQEEKNRAGQKHGSSSYPAAPAVLRLLDRPGDPEDKDFARLRSICGADLAGVLGSPNFRHGADIYATAYAPDGKTAWTGGGDGWLRLWDLETGREIRSFQGHTDWVRACALSADGQRLLSGSDDKTLKLWDAASGKEIRSFQGHQGYVYACALSADGQRLLSGSDDKTLKLWDAASGKEIRSFQGHQGYVYACALSADGQRLLSGSDDKTLKLWDAASGKEIRSFQGHQGYVYACALSADGQRLLSGSDDNTLKLWDAASGKEIRSFQGHQGYVLACALSADGQRLLSGSSDNTLKLWDAASGKEIRSFQGHTDWVRACALSADGQRLLSGSSDNTLKLWDAASGKEIRSFQGHTDWVRACALSADGQRLLSGSDDNTLKLWDAASGKEIRSFQGHQGYVYACALSADGQRLLSGSDDNTLKLWDAASGKEIRSFQGHTGWVRACALSADGQRLLSGSDDNTLKLWDAASGKEIRSFQGHQGYVYACALSADGQRLLSGSSDKTLKLWDAASGKEIRSFQGHTGWVRACALSADGQRLLSGSSDKTLKLWDAASGKEIRSFQGHQGSVDACALSADGQRLLSGSDDNTLKLWDAASGKEIRSWNLSHAALTVAWTTAAPTLWPERQRKATILAAAVGLRNGTVLLFDLTGL